MDVSLLDVWRRTNRGGVRACIDCIHYRNTWHNPVDTPHHSLICVAPAHLKQQVYCHVLGVTRERESTYCREYNSDGWCKEWTAGTQESRGKL